MTLLDHYLILGAIEKGYKLKKFLLARLKQTIKKHERVF